MDCVLIPFFVLFGSLLFFFVWCFVPSQAEQMKKFLPSTIIADYFSISVQLKTIVYLLFTYLLGER